jgi:hypothetical protein
MKRWSNKRRGLEAIGHMVYMRGSLPKLAHECCNGQEKNGKWRMCTDFTDLNKYCPKDDFPITRIEQVVDSAAGYETMALLDCFLGYHQIWLDKEDEEKTSFITPFGTYCYLNRIPEGLKNVGLTFCRMTA